MKDLVRKATAFILFESPVDSKLIGSDFLITHHRYKAQFPHWSFSASRKKLIVKFWFGQVSPHFLILLILAIAVLFLLKGIGSNSVPPIFVTAVFTFCILVVLSYGPVFYADYLPKLVTIIAEQEKLAAGQEELKKCKRSQYPIAALTIIFYVWSKLADIPMVPVNDHSAALLNHLYGTDKDKLKQNLLRLYKLSTLSPKEKAEMQKGIDSARSFFNDLQHPPADKLLDQLELKLQKA